MRLGLSPLDQRNMEAHVCERLTQLLVSGALPPGTRVTEERLASELGVSRTPIREALRRLAQDGLVELLPRRGINIRRLSRRDAKELYQIRSALEGLATYLAATEMSDNDIQTLKAELERAGESFAAGEVSEAKAFDVEVHGLIIKRCGSRRLQRLLEPLHNMANYLRSQYGGAVDPANPSHVEHKAIIAALERRDPDEAERKMRDHLAAAGERVLQYLPLSPEENQFIGE